MKLKATVEAVTQAAASRQALIDTFYDHVWKMGRMPNSPMSLGEVWRTSLRCGLTRCTVPT